MALMELVTSLSGWLKISECIFIFSTLVLHRHGDNGNYLFFATTGTKLGYDDSNIDAENLGNSTLVTFMIINLVLILGYVLDGREYIQQTILEPIWSLLGACMFIGSGTVAIQTWKDESFATTSYNTAASEIEYTRDVSAAMAMGGLCIVTGLVYLVDFGVAWYNRGKQPADDYDYER